MSRLNYLNRLDKCLTELRAAEMDIQEVADIILNAYKDCKQIFIMGNGGSASTASHFARDLSIGTAIVGKRRLRVQSLTDNIALITALANDINFSAIFAEQLYGQIDRGDVVIGISVSGDSLNIIEAIRFARRAGAVTIGLVGSGGGQVKEKAHKCIILSSHDYGPVEDTHLCLTHIISYMIKGGIAGV